MLSVPGTGMTAIQKIADMVNIEVNNNNKFVLKKNIQGGWSEKVETEAEIEQEIE